MDDRGVNIDILFRNGLKDHEVLPPAEVWNNIRPAIRKNQQPIVILRAAAMIAVLLSLSFLAYRWSLEISSGLAGSGTIINPESQNPGTGVPTPGIPQNSPGTTGRVLLSDASVPVSESVAAVAPAMDNDKADEVIYQHSANEMPLNNFLIKPKSDLVTKDKTGANPIVIHAEPLQYDPEIAAKDMTNRWSVAALVSPTYYSAFLSGNNTLADQLMAEEQSHISYAGGFALSYKINKRFSVQSGLYYSSFGQELTGISSYGGFHNYDYTKGDHNFEVLTTSGTVYTNNADVFLLDPKYPDRIITRYTNDVFDPAKANLQYLDNSLRQNFSYLELPFVLKYKIIDKGVDFNIIGGISSNLLVSNSVYATLNNGKYPVGKTEGMNTITFSSSLGMGMEYSLSKNFSFNLEPTLRYYLNPFNEVSGIKIHPYSFGIFSGLSYKF
jgi:hypothetical protein